MLSIEVYKMYTFVRIRCTSEVLYKGYGCPKFLTNKIVMKCFRDMIVWLAIVLCQEGSKFHLIINNQQHLNSCHINTLNTQFILCYDKWHKQYDAWPKTTQWTNLLPLACTLSARYKILLQFQLVYEVGGTNECECKFL